MTQNEEDLHITCDNKKKCIIFKDKAEKFPILSFETVSKESKGFTDNYIQVEKLQKHEKLFVTIHDSTKFGENEKTIVSSRFKVRSQH